MINKNYITKLLSFFFIFFAITNIVATCSLYNFLYAPLTVANPGVTIEIPYGCSVKKLASRLVEHNIINNPYVFYLLVKIYNLDKTIQAGEYLITENLNLKDLLTNIVNGKVTQHPFTIVEGWNISKLLDTLSKQKNITQQDKLSLNAIVKALNIPRQNLEGLFLAETYYYTANTPAMQLLTRIYKESKQFLEQAWQHRDMHTNLNQYETLILASIIEKETALREEMPLIAGVYLSRLEKHMKLQADPTVIYAHGSNFQGNLTKEDLNIDSPYNTYLYQGLPPTPIAMPGKEAINAVLHPIKTDNLYFVANGQGGHTFSKTLHEHQQAVEKYNQVRQ